MKNLVVALACCLVVCTAANARATYPLTIRGGMTSGFSPINVAPNVTGTVGWYSPEEAPRDMLHVLELTFGGVAVGADQNALRRIPDSTSRKTNQLVLAPGIRFIKADTRLQPFFALHAGSYPLLVSFQNAAPTPTGSTVTDTTALQADMVGMDMEIGLRLRLMSRLAVSVGAGGNFTWSLSGSSAPYDAGKGFHTWQLAAALTVDVGAMPVGPP